MFLPNPIKRFGRYVQISRVLLKYGFGEYIKTLHPAFLLAQLGLGKKRIAVRPIQQRLRLALEELGPTFIKLGQVASTRGDILPEEFTIELAKLQDEVKPVPFQEIKKVIESEVGTISSVFDELQETPIGSASIAQVYRAKYQGEQIIVKVRRPGIEKMINLDIDILTRLSSIAEKNIPAIRQREPKLLIETFARTINRELDFLNEASNAQRFREYFQGDNRIYIPKVYREISSSKVLVQEHIDGVKISNIAMMAKNGIAPEVIAQNGADIILKQILINGFFHADPHPGNIFVKENNLIIPIDFGMVGRIDPRLKEELTNGLIGVVKRDPEIIARVLKNIGVVRGGIETDSLREDILYILDKFEGRGLAQISVKEFINDINRVIRYHRIRMPQEFLYLGKALSQAESIGRQLDPKFDTINSFKAFVERNHLGILSIREVAAKGRWWLKDMLTILQDLPENLERFFDYQRQLPPVEETNNNLDNRIYWFLSGFGIMAISIFVFLVASLPLLKILAIFGLVFSGIIFIGQMVVSVIK